jgi:hypothetical protein
MEQFSELGELARAVADQHPGQVFTREAIPDQRFGDVEDTTALSRPGREVDVSNIVQVFWIA